MIRKLLYFLPIFLLAFVVLVISVLRTASIKYEFNGDVISERGPDYPKTDIPYNLAYPGKILSTNPLWPIKALRDWVWLMVTTNPNKKAEVNLLFADKRLAMSQIFFDRGEIEIAYATLLKAEQYLEEASALDKNNRASGGTAEFSRVLAYASLKHLQLIKNFETLAPDDAKPKLVELEKIPLATYNESMHALHENGIKPPENPF